MRALCLPAWPGFVAGKVQAAFLLHSSEASGNGRSQQHRMRATLGFLVEKFLGVSEDKLALWRGCQCCFSSGEKLLGWFVPGSSQAAARGSRGERDLSSPMIYGLSGSVARAWPG